MIDTAEYVAWLPMILFCAAPLAQMYVNWRRHATKHLSHWTVLLGITGLVCSLLYDHFFCLPFAYRLLHPLILLAWVTLALQEFWYDQGHRSSKGLLASYGLVLLFTIAALFWGQYYPLEVGRMAGWLFTLLYAVFQVPQILKNQKARSVAGLSFWYVSLLGIASCIELGIAYWRLLPLQSILNALRGILVYVLFIYQFLVFSKAGKAPSKRRA